MTVITECISWLINVTDLPHCLGKINYLLNKQTKIKWIMCKAFNFETNHSQQTTLNISLHDLLQTVHCPELGHNTQTEAPEGHSDMQQQAQKLNEVMKLHHT
jgi:hypothetical protein